MKQGKKVLLILILCGIIPVLSMPAYAEKQKGFFIRLWERVSARFPKEEKPPAQKEMIPGREAEMPKEEKRAVPAVPVKPAEEDKEEIPERKAPPERKVVIPKERMLEVIERRLKVFPRIVDIIPYLSREEATEGGEIEYRYVLDDGTRVKLEDLDKETLYNLYVRINNEATRLHTERILRQIQQQEQLMRTLKGAPRPPRQPVAPPPAPPEPPRVYTPPRTPAQPPSAPAGPERRR
jgi:hypothetical protein